ncbi:ribokinase [Alkalihalophilus marmarensis]|uniref:ribokinase n=1 Tax=Alkalihalophilus marmarensis TaxID=521377 RepID=UPI002DBC632A|nr:ribokinase [Alkalihalophilus marmarensis]MEC2072347.1 ribokinase [Alkalihalophilus marmarensis]
MAKVMVVGSINSDLVVQVERYPHAGETLNGSELAWFPGGKGANQAVAASRLGAKVTMVGAVGRDFYGDELIHSLQLNLVDISYVKRTSGASGAAIITVEQNGENRIILSQGANKYVTLVNPEELDGIDWLVVQNEIPWSVTEAAIKLAHERGVKVLVNPAPAAFIPHNLYPLVDVLVVNEVEAKEIMGAKADELSEEDTARKLVSLGAKAVLLTLGARGSLYVTQDKVLRIPAYPVKNIVDTTAAGDTFIGGFIAGVTAGKAIEEALQFATAASAVAISRLGAQVSIPTKGEVEAFIQKH